MNKIVPFYAIIIAYLYFSWYNYTDEVNIASDFSKKEFIYEENYFEEFALKRLEEVILSGNISMILEDEGIGSAGEGVPPGHPDCDHQYMTLNKKGDSCFFPNRLDIGMHYMKTGGFRGHKEFFNKSAARLFSFRRKLLKSTAENFTELYGDKFIRHSKELCLKTVDKKFTAEKLVTEIFQFDVIVILPGQELPMHLDIPYFWNADRRSLPHWLLAIMKSSKLFDDLFIPQIQGVSWLSKHQYNKNAEQSKYNGGNFFFYPFTDEHADKYILLKSKYNSAALLDGTQVVHGVERFKPSEDVPAFMKNRHYQVAFSKADKKWMLYDSGEIFMRNYLPEDLRISLVWRVHCFEDENERQKYHQQKNENQIPIEQIIERFKKDLKAKNKLPSGDIKLLDLYSILVDEYANYPIPNKAFKAIDINYCMLPQYFKSSWAKSLLNGLLQIVC
jgi:hypothetical protein